MLDRGIRRAIIAGVATVAMFAAPLALAQGQGNGNGNRGGGGNGGEIYMVSFGNGELSVPLEGEQLVVSNAAGQRAVLGEEAVVSKNGVIIPIDKVLVDTEALAVPAEG